MSATARVENIKPEKIEAVRQIKEMLKDGKAFYLIDFKGWNVAEITKLRRDLKNNDARMRVVKNTLLRIALRDEELYRDEMAPFLEGPTALVVTYRDEIQPLKLINDYIKETNKGNIKAVFIGDTLYHGDAIKQLVKLPSIEQLRGQVVGAFAAPMYGLVFALGGLLRNLVNVLEQIKEKKGE